MKRMLSVLAAAAAIVAAPGHAPAAKDRAEAPLNSVGGSGVSGTVHLVQLPHGGSTVHVSVRGLEPGHVYASFYYESADCTAPADLFESFTANPSGTAELQGKIDDDVDEVGSVSVRVGPSYGTLLACAALK